MGNDKNPISELKEYHDRQKKQNNLEEPKYTLSQVGTSFSAQCTYNSVMTEGIGNSKSVAKTEAAKLMLSKLDCYVPTNSYCLSNSTMKSEPRPTLPKYISDCSSMSSETEKLASDFIEKYSSAHAPNGFFRYPPTPDDLEVCFSDIHFGMKSPNSPKSETVKNQGMHPILCFLKVMEELQLEFCCEQVEVEPDSRGNFTHVILLKINFYCMVVGGTGETIGEAVLSACRNGVDTFRLYMK